MHYDASVTVPSVYIHWPFCPYRCRFCPFIAMAGHDAYMERYSNALQNEIRSFYAGYQGDRRLSSLYVGGGTPSSWPEQGLLDTFGTLNNVLSFENAEVTLEVNPGTVSKNQLILWRKVGINRLSIGVQALYDDVLRRLGRYQTAADAVWLVEQAAPHFDSLSIDLIVGLPGITTAQWKETIRTVVSWPITHISIYFLSIHRETRLYGDIKQGTIHLPDEDTVINHYTWAVDFLSRYDFRRYELSNFARPGYASRHNTAYWNRSSYKGFGLGAWSFDGQRRLCTKKNLLSYINAAENNESLVEQHELLSPQQSRLEKIMLGLRQMKGVEEQALFQGCSRDKVKKLEETLADLKRENLLVQVDGWLRLTPAGLLLENSIAEALF